MWFARLIPGPLFSIKMAYTPWLTFTMELFEAGNIGEN